jgi:CBS domain-containing protein
MSIRKLTDDESKGERRKRAAPVIPFSSAALHAPVSAIMETEVVCVHEDMSLEDLLTFFLDHGLHDAPAVSEGSVLAGFVSLGDLHDRADRGDMEETALRVELRGGGSYTLGRGFHLQQSARTVADIMTRPVVCLEASAQLTKAAALMAFEGVRRLPIVDAEKRVVGILSALDLLRWIGRQDGYSIPDYTQRTRRRAWQVPGVILKPETAGWTLEAARGLMHVCP